MTSKNINYKLIVPDEAIWVYGDTVRLHQCFINILGNAVKFSNPQDEITVRQIVEMHEGAVYAESEGVGKGATFTIEIPVIELTEEDQGADLISKPIVSSNEDYIKPVLQVLIVEDNIISDLTLPGTMDGWQLVERIRQSVPEDKLPYMVALSGLAQPSDIQRSIDAGFNKHLAKPIDSQEIFICLESAYLFKSK